MSLRPLLALALCASALAPACGRGAEPAAGPRPNVLWIVWDTVRADRLSLYGHGRPTTPFLEEWARGARTFENCVSTAGSTVPSHASMFTGLLPSEHGTTNADRHLDGGHVTAAERFRAAGYRTYLWAANPHISAAHQFTQGFDREEHPWDERFEEEAVRILRAKLDPSDASSELPGRLRGDARLRTWDVKAAGALAQRGLLEFLGEDPGRPFFAFLNYMEAHRPFVPSAEHRRRVMSPDQVERSYAVDRSWETLWRYTFGLHEYSAEELEVMALTYEATLAELDDLFRDLIGALERGGYLEDTIVVLTSDHGEHLGEHHMLDHQYSLYEGLVRVPLVLSYPGRVPPGRETRPVANHDVLPTLLELADLPLGEGRPPSSRSLLAPLDERPRLAEHLAQYPGPIKTVVELHPDFDPDPFQRQLRAYYEGPLKLIWSSDGRHELYDLSRGHDEREDLASQRPEETRRLVDALEALVDGLEPHRHSEEGAAAMTEAQRRRLRAVGYFDD